MGIRAIIMAAVGLGSSALSLGHPYYGLLLLGVLYFFRPETWAEEIVRPVLWLTVAIFAGWLINRKPGKVLAGAYWLVALLGLYAASTAFAPMVRADSWDRLYMMFKIFVVVFLIIRLCDSPRGLAAMVAAILLGQLWFVKTALVEWANMGFSGEVRIESPVGQSGGSNYIAWVLATSFGWMLYKAVRGQRWERVLAFGLLPLWIAAIVATGSRGGLLCLAMSGMVCLLLTRQAKAIALALAVAAAFYFLAPAAYLERISTITMDPGEMDASALARYQNIQIGLDIIRDHPLFGTGLETFATAKLQYVPADYVGNPKTVAHNTYVQMASEAGLPVLTCFLGITAWIVWGLIRKSRGELDAQSLSHLEWVRVGVLSAIAASMMEMAKGDIAHMDYLWWLYGIAVCARTIRGHPLRPAFGRLLPIGNDSLRSPEERRRC